MSRRLLVTFLVLAALVFTGVDSSAQETVGGNSWRALENDLSASLSRNWSTMQSGYIQPKFASFEDQLRRQVASQGIHLDSYSLEPPVFHTIGWGVVDTSAAFEVRVSKKIFWFIKGRWKLTYTARIRIYLANPFTGQRDALRRRRVVSSNATVRGQNLIGKLVVMIAGSKIKDAFHDAIERMLLQSPIQPVEIYSSSDFAHRTGPTSYMGRSTPLSQVESPFFYDQNNRVPHDIANRGYVIDGYLSDPRLSRMNIVFVGDGFNDHQAFIYTATMWKRKLEKDPTFQPFTGAMNFQAIDLGGLGLQTTYVMDSRTGQQKWTLDGDHLEKVLEYWVPAIRRGAQTIVVVIVNRHGTDQFGRTIGFRGVASPVHGITLVGAEPGVCEQCQQSQGEHSHMSEHAAHVFLHEMGHITGFLTDEYAKFTSELIPRDMMNQPWFPEIFEILHPNLTLVDGDRPGVTGKWDAYSDNIDEIGYFVSPVRLYPGSTRPIYMPQKASRMGDETLPFGPVDGKLIQDRLYYLLPLRPATRTEIRDLESGNLISAHLSNGFVSDLILPSKGTFLIQAYQHRTGQLIYQWFIERGNTSGEVVVRRRIESPNKPLEIAVETHLAGPVTLEVLEAPEGVAIDGQNLTWQWPTVGSHRVRLLVKNDRIGTLEYTRDRASENAERLVIEYDLVIEKSDKVKVTLTYPFSKGYDLGHKIEVYEQYTKMVGSRNYTLYRLIQVTNSYGVGSKTLALDPGSYRFRVFRLRQEYRGYGRWVTRSYFVGIKDLDAVSDQTLAFTENGR